MEIYFAPDISLKVEQVVTHLPPACIADFNGSDETKDPSEAKGLYSRLGSSAMKAWNTL